MSWMLRESSDSLAGIVDKEKHPEEFRTTQEKLIANQLFRDCQVQNPQAFEILESTGDKTFTVESFLAGAKLVILSTKE